MQQVLLALVLKLQLLEQVIIPVPTLKLNRPLQVPRRQRLLLSTHSDQVPLARHQN